jgi:hypothetical protein
MNIDITYLDQVCKSDHLRALHLLEIAWSKPGSIRMEGAGLFFINGFYERIAISEPEATRLEIG